MEETDPHGPGQRGDGRSGLARGVALAPWLSGTQWQKIMALVLIVGTGMTVYGILALAMRATSLAALRTGFGETRSSSK